MAYDYEDAVIPYDPTLEKDERMKDGAERIERIKALTPDDWFPFLPPIKRAVLFLYIQKSKSILDTAELIGIPTRTVRPRAAAALKEISRHMNGNVI